MQSFLSIRPSSFLFLLHVHIVEPYLRGYALHIRVREAVCLDPFGDVAKLYLLSVRCLSVLIIASDTDVVKLCFHLLSFPPV